MVRTGRSLWAHHPAVDNDLTTGERAADRLKRSFGTWTALGIVAAAIAVWITLQATGARFDPYPFILLNLCLSCLAAVQGIILQISANRGDKKAAEVALHTEANTNHLIAVDDELLTLQRGQCEMLAALAADRVLLTAVAGKLGVPAVHR